MTEAEIREAVEGRAKVKAASLRELLQQGRVTREGTGKKGDPYVYSIARQCSFPESDNTAEQASKNPADLLETKEQILVPEQTPGTSIFRELEFSPNADHSSHSGRSIVHSSEVLALQSPPAEQSPPKNASSPNPLNTGENHIGETQVPQVPAFSSHVLDGPVGTGVISRRTDLCPHCGPVEWVWASHVWACPKCGDPAPGQKKHHERERIEI